MKGMMITVKYTIDRFEDGFAVLEDESGRISSVTASLLPVGLCEGDAVEFYDGKYYHINNSSDRARIQSKFDKLKK